MSMLLIALFTLIISIATLLCPKELIQERPLSLVPVRPHKAQDVFCGPKENQACGSRLLLQYFCSRKIKTGL